MRWIHKTNAMHPPLPPSKRRIPRPKDAHRPTWRYLVVRFSDRVFFLQLLVIRPVSCVAIVQKCYCISESLPPSLGCRK